MEQEWLHSISKSNTASIVDIANIAVIFNEAEFITFVLKKGDSIQSEDWKSLSVGLAKMHELGVSTTIRFDLSRCSSDDKEDLYIKAVSSLSEFGEKYKCNQEDCGNLLVFDVTARGNHSDSGSVSSASSSLLYQRVQNIISNLSEAQSLMTTANQERNKEHGPFVWNSGQRYYFWKSFQRHPNFVTAKFKDLKDEFLNSPLLKGIISAKEWDNLVAKVHTRFFRICDIQILHLDSMDHLCSLCAYQ